MFYRSLFFSCMFLVSQITCLFAQQPTGFEPFNSPAYQKLLRTAYQSAAEGKSQQAVDAITQALETTPKLPELFYLRGRENFRIGNFQNSVADFNQYIKLKPEVASSQWERGISCYYANQYAAGADQFKLYQSYHDNDVENSVWRYLCVAKAQNITKAQATMLPIDNDPRIPMMTIYDMYRGKANPEDVLKKIEEGEPDKSELAGRKFYADLYLGLYYEVHEESKKSKTFIKAAADKQVLKDAKGRINTYMWDVARIHHERNVQLEKSATKNKSAEESSK